MGQYLGDGIVAFWGAPEALEDHATRACRGALAMHEHAQQLAEAAMARGEPVLTTRIGIDTGELMVGNIGAPERFNYGVLGRAANSASRFETLNKRYGTSIIAGPRTVALARDTLLFRPLDQVVPRGSHQPVLIHELIGLKGEVADERLALVAGYTSALEVYLDGRFEEALAAFRTVLQRAPDDGPSQIMIRRCEALIANPPAPRSWTGVYGR